MNALEQLDATLDTVEELIFELPMSIVDQNKCIDMLYAMYQVAESSTLEVDTTSLLC